MGGKDFPRKAISIARVYLRGPTTETFDPAIVCVHVCVHVRTYVRVYVGRARISSFLGNHGPEVARKIISPKTGYTGSIHTCPWNVASWRTDTRQVQGASEFNKFCRTGRKNPRRIPMEFRTMRWIKEFLGHSKH